MDSLPHPVVFNKQVQVVLCKVSENGKVSGLFEMDMKWSDTITEVRNAIRQYTGVPHDLIDIIYGGKKLPRNYCLYQLEADHNQIKLVYFCRSQDSRANSWIRIVSTNSLDRLFLDAVDDARNAFSIGIKPELSLYGSGGTYFLNDCYKWNLLAFKPEDEEPFADNNPRDLQGITGHSGFRKGIKSGEGWKREIAAYLLDRDHIFSVPTTVQALVKHPYFSQQHPNVKFKVGSLQLFVADADLCSDWSPSKYSVFDVQKIAFLDMYIMNTDRNDANILVKRIKNNSFVLVPIDHGYSLTDRFELNELSWCWQGWKHTNEPWDSRLVEYAEKIDINADIKMLNECLGIRKVCLVMLKLFFLSYIITRISGMLLKMGIKRGLTPQELSKFYIRQEVNQERPCILEKMVQESVERVKAYRNVKQMISYDSDILHRVNSQISLPSPDSRDAVIRNMLTQSLPGMPYSEEPYRFPPDVEYRLIHDQEFRHLFYSVLEDSMEFWISTILNRRVYNSGIFV